MGVPRFLSKTLSRRGAGAVPYEKDLKGLVREHLVSLTQAFPSLLAKASVYTHVDGRTVNLFQAEGTVPIMFQHVVYHIPVTIWLLESYPRQAPSVYVSPTKDMLIKPNHPYVNPSGVVSIPYLEEWVFPSSNLADLVINLSLIFGKDPPVYTKQTANTAQLQPRPNISDTRVSSLTYSSSQGTDNPSDVFRHNAINKLVENLNTDIAESLRKTEGEMEKLLSIQVALRKRGEELATGLRDIQTEKETCEEELQLVLTNIDVLETWLRNNKAKIKHDIDIDDVFVACDILSKQMLECISSEQAIDDVLYSLDRTMQEGRIPLQAYLKNVKALSREQFYLKATANKVRDLQMQSAISGMASRASS